MTDAVPVRQKMGGNLRNGRQRRKERPMKLVFIVTVLATIGCADHPGPASPSATSPSAIADAPSLAASAPRSGAFQLTKECSTYSGHAGDHCTVIASDLKAIEVGTRFVYAQPVVNGVLDSSIVLDPPGPGNNKASGHCRLDLTTGLGLCTFSGGTGKFTWFQGSADVSCPAVAAPNCAVEGTYSFSPRD
jgi:hypothetical protein